MKTNEKGVGSFDVPSLREEEGEYPEEVQVFLSRRNLLSLLNKLDRNKKDPGASACTLTKRDMENEKYPQTHSHILVTAVEDEDYYSNRLRKEKS